jgi:hypothetical protein
MTKKKRVAGPGKKLGPPFSEKPIKVMISKRIDAELVEYLASSDNATAAIEAAIRGTKLFKEWKASRT